MTLFIPWWAWPLLIVVAGVVIFDRESRACGSWGFPLIGPAVVLIGFALALGMALGRWLL